MKLQSMPKTTKRKKKRVGRGYGSGKGGHTVGRGAKGQKARSKVKIWFEGGQLALIRRLPKTRGKGKFKPLKSSPVIVKLKDLTGVTKDAVITEATLAEAGIVKEDEVKKFGVKILGDGEIKTKVTVKVPTSQKAKEKIEKAGGKVE
ncbi:50S ribosomal protein L15 [Patescibacteria group bacterium]|nr:50S ribosomal protein L15 [Patescibacteria group bacterium]